MDEVLDARAIFRVLAEHRVDYLLVGGLAVQAHGFRRGTVDIDIVPAPALSNLSRLGEAVASIGARVFRSATSVNIGDPHLLRRASLVPLMTDHGRIDILNVASTAGLPADYGALRERAVEIELDEATVAVIGLDDLIRMKRAAGREQDLEDIRALAALDEDLAREAREST
jgi:predicted nucleotidyltransferase